MSLWSRILPSTPWSLSSFSFCLNCCLGVLHRARRRLPHPTRTECGRGCCSHTVRAPGRAGYCASGAPLGSRTHTHHTNTHYLNKRMHGHTREQGSSFSSPRHNIPHSAVVAVTEPSPHHTQSWTWLLLHLLTWSKMKKEKNNWLFSLCNWHNSRWLTSGQHQLFKATTFGKV